MTVKNNDLDTPWKDILNIYFQAFIEMCYPEAAKAIDWSKGYETLDKELSTITKNAETGKRIVDKLMKIWRIDGQETWVLLHIEIQSQPKANFAERMYIYHYRLFDYYQKPVVSLAILADEYPKWRPTDYEYNLWGCQLYFKFTQIKLLDYNAKYSALISSNNPFAMIILAHLEALATKRDEQKRFLTKISLTRLLYKKGFDKKAILNLHTFLDYVMALPTPLELKYYNEVIKYEEENHMRYITSVERIGMQRGMEKGLEKGMEKGMAKGIEKGIEKGIAKGIEKGMQKATIETLLRLLQIKFKIEPSHFQQKLEQADMATLRTWFDTTVTANTLEEVFK